MRNRLVKNLLNTLSNFASMSKNKTRNKPRKPSLQNLPIQAVRVQGLNKDMHNSLLRLRLSGLNGKDLGILVSCFGQGWLLTESMSNGENLKVRFEKGVADLVQVVRDKENNPPQSNFDTLVELIELTISIVKVSTQNEYAVACKKLETARAVEFVDQFLIELTNAKLLELSDH